MIKSSEILLNFTFILGYPLLFIFYGMDFTDGPWNMRMAQSSESFMPYWLTAEIGYLWSVLFGDSMISFRLLNYIFFESVIFLFLFSFFYNKNILQFSRYALATIILTMSTTSFTFNYGTTTLLCLAILFVCLIKFSCSSSVKYIVISGFVSVIAILSRFPNIVIIPVILLLLALFTFIKQMKTTVSNKNKFLILSKLYLVYGVSCLFTILVFFIVISPQNYYSNLNDILTAYSQSDNYHSQQKMLGNYIRDIIALAKYLSFIILLCLGFLLSINYLKLKKWAVGIIVFIYYSYFLLITNPGNYNFGWSINTTSFTFFVISILSYHFYLHKKFLHLFILISISILMFIPALGSNTGLLKVKTFANLTIVFLMYWISKEKLKYSQLKYFISILLISLITYSIFNRITWFYGESDKIYALKYTINHKKLKTIKTTVYRKELVEKIVNEIDKLNLHQNEIVFFGKAGQLFYYLYDQPGLSKQLFYLESDDKNALEQLESAIKKEKKHPLVVIIFGHPNSGNWPQILFDLKNDDRAKYLEKSKDLIKMLAENKYKEVLTDNTFLILN